MRSVLVLVSLLAATALARPVNKPIGWKVGATEFEGVLVYDDAVKAPRPGLVLVPNWLGINPANLKQAELVAGDKYVVLVADVYGKASRPKNPEEAGKASGALKADRKALRERTAKALEVLLAQAKATNLDTTHVAATGFCFGGTAALELARSGARLSAVAVFHAGLSSPTPDDARNIKAKVLAMQGGDDPFVPADEVKAFEDEMRKANVDWQLVQFGGTVHSYTDVDANSPGQAQYNPRSAKRAYQLMNEFLAEAFSG